MTTPALDADCIIVGSGPAGVSASFPLVNAGARVLMIDGTGPSATSQDESDAPWRRMLGDELEALQPEDGLSPKLRTPVARRIVRDFQRANPLQSDGFVAVGSVARGGLSQIWGAFVCEFDANDIRNWPFPIEDIRPSYEAVVERVGICGSSVDEMAAFFGRSGPLLPAPPIGHSAARLLQNYRPGSAGPEFGLGIARNAILTLDRGSRRACELRNDCLWGCPRGAIYDARFDLAKLERFENFRLVDDALAVGLSPVAGGWQVSTRDGRKFAAPRIALAAGTLGTAALVIPLLPEALNELALLNNPVLALPLLVPARLGKSPTAKGHSLAQLGYRLRFGDDPLDYVAGAIYEIDGLPASSFTARLPFGRRAGSTFFGAIAPALLVATSYFSGGYSDNKLRWQREDGAVSITVHGGIHSELQSKVDLVRSRLKAIWRRLGALSLPGAALATPGTDVHYAGLFAMGSARPSGSTAWGELHAAPGVYVADGSALPTLPAKYSTLTIMANADRIGRRLASVICETPSHA